MYTNQFKATRDEAAIALGVPPQVGMLYTVRGIVCRIVHILPAGAIEVVSLDGERAFRVSGLGFRS